MKSQNGKELEEVIHLFYYGLSSSIDVRYSGLKVTTDDYDEFLEFFRLEDVKFHTLEENEEKIVYVGANRVFKVRIELTPESDNGFVVIKRIKLMK